MLAQFQIVMVLFFFVEVVASQLTFVLLSWQPFPKTNQNIDHFSFLEESGLFYVQSICSQLLIDLLTVVSYLSYQHFEEEAQQAINQRKIHILHMRLYAMDWSLHICIGYCG